MIGQIEISTHSAPQTRRVGFLLAKELLKTEKKRALVIALKGDIGGGKTTFVKGMAKGLKIKEEVLSPTFVILKRYELKEKRFKNFYHFDCYRIEKEEEMAVLRFQKIIANVENIVVIEWSERIKKLLPDDFLAIDFQFIDEKTRKLTFQGL